MSSTLTFKGMIVLGSRSFSFHGDLFNNDLENGEEKTHPLDMFLILVATFNNFS